MVVGSIVVCSRIGSPILCRNYLAIPFGRLESLLQTFPCLVKAGQQHSFVENDRVRFIFQSYDQLYLVLITSKSSNLLVDLETLHLANRILSSTCVTVEEGTVLEKFSDLIFAFDELVTLGNKEASTLPQINTILAMESQEEAMQELIEKNKIQEAKQVAKLKAKELEQQKKEALKGSSGNNIVRFAAGPEKVATEIIDLKNEDYSSQRSLLQRPGKGMSLKMKQ